MISPEAGAMVKLPCIERLCGGSLGFERGCPMGVPILAGEAG